MNLKFIPMGSETFSLKGRARIEVLQDLYRSRRIPSMGTAFALSIMGLAAISVLGAIPVAYAATSQVDSTWCSPFPAFLWDAGTSTCTMFAGYTISSGDTLEVPSGTTLTIAALGHIDVNLGGSLTVDSGGTINIETSGTDGILNSGILTNSGTITISNSGGVLTSGIENQGILTSLGSMSLAYTGCTTGGCGDSIC